ncbi:MAG: hypothetical protein RBR97_19070 [Bacteroidales bacterium]|nr:hypothetical protein [Bacteroidales bacterium]
MKTVLLNYENIADTLRNIKISLLSLSKRYGIEIVKKIFPDILIENSNFYLIMNPTNLKNEFGDNLKIFFSFAIPSIRNYKATNLAFSVVLV